GRARVPRHRSEARDDALPRLESAALRRGARDQAVDLEPGMGTKKLSVMDAMFLAAETRESMMHVGGMLTFTLPPDAPSTFLRQIADELRGDVPVYAPWNLRLRFPDLLRNPVQSWVEDEVDLDYHVRRSALPSPGDERELGILVSRLHSI